MPNLIDVLLGRKVDETRAPECPQHKVELQLRGKVGRPSRFAGTSQEDYTLIFFCPTRDCNHTAEREVRRTQIPVPGAQPRRPEFSRSADRERKI